MMRAKRKTVNRTTRATSRDRVSPAAERRGHNPYENGAFRPKTGGSRAKPMSTKRAIPRVPMNRMARGPNGRRLCRWCGLMRRERAKRRKDRSRPLIEGDGTLTIQKENYEHA